MPPAPRQGHGDPAKSMIEVEISIPTKAPPDPLKGHPSPREIHGEKALIHGATGPWTHKCTVLKSTLLANLGFHPYSVCPCKTAPKIRATLSPVHMEGVTRERDAAAAAPAQR